MHLSWWIRIRSIWYALALHIIAAALLVFSFSFTEPIKPSHMDISIVNAVTVDKAQVDKELQRLKQEEEQRVEELQKQTEAEKKKAEDLKKQRQEEEKKLLEAQKKKVQEQKLREEEQKKLALLAKEKEELEKQKKLEEEKKAQIEAERKLQEKLAEEKRQKEEEEKKRLAAEAELQKQLDAEAAEAQRQQDLTLQQQIARDIYNKVSRNFNQTGLPEGLACTLRVRLLPGGDVVDVAVTKSSGNDIFDRRALTAVQKASPLPIPDDNAIFERLNLRDVTFTFKP
jgi:colicin import membrane protein